MLAVRHECVCGHAILICMATGSNDGFGDDRPLRWPTLVREAAERIGASYIESEGNTRFNCSSCGAVLLLLTPPPAGADIAYQALARPLVGSLN